MIIKNLFVYKLEVFLRATELFSSWEFLKSSSSFIFKQTLSAWLGLKFAYLTKNCYTGWKEAISSDHVKLVFTPDSEPPGGQSVQDCELAADAYLSSDADKCGVLASTENRFPATSGVARSKPKTKPEKGMKIKYIPKQKAAA